MNEEEFKQVLLNRDLLCYINSFTLRVGKKMNRSPITLQEFFETQTKKRYSNTQRREGMYRWVFNINRVRQEDTDMSYERKRDFWNRNVRQVEFFLRAYTSDKWFNLVIEPSFYLKQTCCPYEVTIGQIIKDTNPKQLIDSPAEIYYPPNGTIIIDFRTWDDYDPDISFHVRVELYETAVHQINCYKLD